MAMWVRIDQPQESLFIAGNHYIGLGLGLPSQNLSIGILDALGESHFVSTRAQSVAAGKWFHVAVVFAQHEQLTVYVDGQAIHKQPLTSPFSLGRRSSLCVVQLSKTPSRRWSVTEVGLARLQICKLAGMLSTPPRCVRCTYLVRSHPEQRTQRLDTGLSRLIVQVTTVRMHPPCGPANR